MSQADNVAVVLSLEMSQRLPCGCVLRHAIRAADPESGVTGLVGVLDFWLTDRVAKHVCPAHED